MQRSSVHGHDGQASSGEASPVASPVASAPGYDGSADENASPSPAATPAARRLPPVAGGGQADDSDRCEHSMPDSSSCLLRPGCHSPSLP